MKFSKIICMWLNSPIFYYQYVERGTLKILIEQFDILNLRALGVGTITSCIHKPAQSLQTLKTRDPRVMLCQNTMSFTFLRFGWVRPFDMSWKKYTQFMGQDYSLVTSNLHFNSFYLNLKPDKFQANCWCATFIWNFFQKQVSMLIF